MSYQKFILSAVFVASSVLSAQAWAGISQECERQCSGVSDNTRCIVDCEGRRTRRVRDDGVSAQRAFSSECRSSCVGADGFIDSGCAANCEFALALGGTSNVADLASELNIVSACRAYSSDPNNSRAVEKIKRSYRVHSDGAVPLQSYCGQIQQNAVALESACNTVLSSSLPTNRSNSQALGDGQEAVALVTIMNSNNSEQLTVGRARLYCVTSGYHSPQLTAEEMSRASHVSDASQLQPRDPAVLSGSPDGMGTFSSGARPAAAEGAGSDGQVPLP